MNILNNIIITEFPYVCLTYNAYSTLGFRVSESGNLTLKNTSQGGGRIDLSPSGSALIISGSNASATVESGVTVETGGNGYAAQPTNGGKLTIKGNASFISNGSYNIVNNGGIVNIEEQATITNTKGVAIQAQGTGAVVNISGGVITGATSALSGVNKSQGGTNTQFNITGGQLNSDGTGIAVLGESPKVTISGGSINAKDFALAGNGSETTNADIKISGNASLTSEGTAAIYNPQSGKLEITGGTISGVFGIVARQGEISVTGGTIKAEGSGTQAIGSPSEQLPAGTAILTDNTLKYGEGKNPASVKVNGPVVIESSNENPVLAYGNTENDGDEITVGAGVDFVNQTVNPVYVQTGLVQGPNGVVMTEAEAEKMAEELANQGKTENPNTADPIALYATVAVLALLGLGATAFLAKKSSR